MLTKRNQTQKATHYVTCLDKQNVQLVTDGRLITARVWEVRNGNEL